MKSLFDLNDKVALITGASSGMGRAIAEAMGTHGAKVIVSSNDTEGGVQTVADFTDKNIEAVFIPCDMSKKADIKQLYDISVEKYGKIDILASCVGIDQPSLFLDISASDFEKTMAINLQSAIYLTKLIIPSMRERFGSQFFCRSISTTRVLRLPFSMTAKAWTRTV